MLGVVFSRFRFSVLVSVPFSSRPTFCGMDRTITYRLLPNVKWCLVASCYLLGTLDERGLDFEALPLKGSLLRTFLLEMLSSRTFPWETLSSRTFPLGTFSLSPFPSSMFFFLLPDRGSLSGIGMYS